MQAPSEHHLYLSYYGWMMSLVPITLGVAAHMGWAPAAAPWVLVVQAVAAGVCMAAACSLSRPLITIRRFLLVGHVPILVVLGSLPLALPQQKLDAVRPLFQQHALSLGAAFVVCALVACGFFIRFWAHKRTLFERAASDRTLSMQQAFSLWSDEDDSKWGQTAVAAILIVAGLAIGTWIGHAFGLRPRTALSYTVMLGGTAIAIGSWAAQWVTVARYPDFAAIRIRIKPA